ncbi:MAG: phosphatidate cytidylyltransferase [Magnetospirillum sp.]|nr:phosphatidate cytidylyltransferase [Magnetospirillum sp.]
MLGARVLSALVMAPPALLAAWLGGYAFAALVLVATGIMCWEWERIITQRFGWSGRVAALGCMIAAVLAVEQPALALLLVVAAALVAAVLARGQGKCPRLWAGLGPLYAGLPAVALVWLRGDGEVGRQTLFWLLLLVWATDIGAYAAGRTIGGPLLMPAVSPKKTWAGLIGGVLSAALVGLAAGWVLQSVHPLALAVGSGALAVVAQAGDLAESWVKRRWGVKDSSNIIPGHGGVLDRVDGLLAAAGAVALVSWATGTAVLQWQ